MRDRARRLFSSQSLPVIYLKVFLTIVASLAVLWVCASLISLFFHHGIEKTARDFAAEVRSKDYEAFPQKGGEVKIGLYRDNEKNMFRLEVSDNGIGIPEDILPRIFEPFYTTKDAEKNTGLGLAVVYGNVQRYGGSINVESKVNEGTTFIINMPIKLN